MGETKRDKPNNFHRLSLVFNLTLEMKGFGNRRFLLKNRGFLQEAADFGRNQFLPFAVSVSALS